MPRRSLLSLFIYKYLYIRYIQLKIRFITFNAFINIIDRNRNLYFVH